VLATTTPRRPSPAVVASTYRALHRLTRKGDLIAETANGPTQWTLDAEQPRRQSERKKRANEEREREKRRQRTKADSERDGTAHLSGEIARLAKILGMVGSPADHEALAAARQAEAVRKRLGVSWSELLTDETVERNAMLDAFATMLAAAEGRNKR
jgi:hypothetical protein